MRNRKLTESNDYPFGGGALDYYRDEPAAVGQAAKTRVLLLGGEWFLDLEEGTPVLQGLLGVQTKDNADATIQQRILETDGVTEIESYESEVDPDTRTLRVECTINTVFGPTAIEIANFRNA